MSRIVHGLIDTLDHLGVAAARGVFRALGKFAGAVRQSMGPYGWWAASIVTGAAIIAAPALAVGTGLITPWVAVASLPPAAAMFFASKKLFARQVRKSAARNWGPASNWSEGEIARPSADEIAQAMVHRFGYQPPLHVFTSDDGPPGPPPRPGLKWKRETQRWVRPDGGEEPHPPADHELAAAPRQGLGGSGGVSKVNVGGQDYVLKEGRSARRYGNETAASALASVAGVNMPATSHATARGLPVTVAHFIPGARTIDQIGVGSKDVAAMRQALSAVPKSDVDRGVLFDYLIGHTDGHNGNYMVDAGNRLHLIDRELSFDKRFGQSFRKPYFLDHLGGVGYTFDPATVADMAARGKQMVAHLQAAGDHARAGVVAERLRVIEALAKEPAPTVGTLIGLGNKGVAPANVGFVRRMIWKLRHAAQLHSEGRRIPGGTTPAE